MTSTIKGQIDGFNFYGLKSETLEVRLVPELGAKIVALKNLLSGREWMWSPPGKPELFKNPPGTPFAAGPKWGLDECLPTIAACQWRGRSLPDHGEAWTAAWTFREDEYEKGSLTTTLQLPLSPLVVSRRLTLTRSRLHFSYTLANISSEKYEYIWALHPLLTIEAGDRLHLPAEVKNATTYLALDCALGEAGTEWRWPNPRPGYDLAQLNLNGLPAAVKFFTRPLTEGWAMVENARSGDYFRVLFDPKQIDTLGIWLNRGGWGGYHHLAIEPTSGAPDALDLAVRTWRRFAAVQPGETRRWEIAIELGCHPPRDPSAPPAADVMGKIP